MEYQGAMCTSIKNTKSGLPAGSWWQLHATALVTCQNSKHFSPPCLYAVRYFTLKNKQSAAWFCRILSALVCPSRGISHSKLRDTPEHKLHMFAIRLSVWTLIPIIPPQRHQKQIKHHREKKTTKVVTGEHGNRMRIFESAATSEPETVQPDQNLLNKSPTCIHFTATATNNYRTCTARNFNYANRESNWI